MIKPALSWVLLSLLLPWASMAQQRCAVQFPAGAAPFESNNLPRAAILKIPVAVHIVWHTPAENISTAQVNSQITALNEDFRALNAQIPDIHPLFDDLSVDTEIEFCLAAITRTPTEAAGIATAFEGGMRRVCYTALGGRDGFDPEHYLNIWVAGRSDGALGYATFPGASATAEDGVFIRPDAFGTTGTVSPPFHLGRTCTHEVGHYLNLQHLWGPFEDNFNCNQDDGVEDTPLQAESYRGACPTLPPLSCGSPDMYMNFMNFTDDACMALFTPGQKQRMLAAIQNFRPGLLTASCEPVSTHGPARGTPEAVVLQNPVSSQLQARLPGNEEARLAIFDLAGRLVLQTTANGPLVTVDCSWINPGNYYIKIWHGNKIHFKKLIIAR